MIRVQGARCLCHLKAGSPGILLDDTAEEAYNETDLLGKPGFLARCELQDEPLVDIGLRVYPPIVVADRVTGSHILIIGITIGTRGGVKVGFASWGQSPDGV